MQDLERYIVDTKDFPKKGVTFKDVSPLLKEKLRETVSAFAALFDKETLDKTDYIAGIDSRGFVFGSALAQYLGKGFIMIRKAGKLPPPTVSERYFLEYGTPKDGLLVEILVDVLIFLLINKELKMLYILH